jgi:hypothetical protein
MTLPDRDVVRHWVDRTAVDADGNDLGTVVRVYAGLHAEAPEWLLISRSEGKTAVVPLVDAADVDGQIRIAVSRDQADRAPHPAEQERLSTEEEAGLYRHYNIEVSTTTSDSPLPATPTGDTAAPAAADVPRRDHLADIPADAGSEEPTILPASAPTTSQAVKKPLPILGAVAALLTLLITRRRLRKRRATRAARRRAPRRVAVKRAAQLATVAGPAQAVTTAAAKSAASVTGAAAAKAAGGANRVIGKAAEPAKTTATTVSTGGATVGRKAGQAGSDVAQRSRELGVRSVTTAGRSGREISRRRRRRRSAAGRRADPVATVQHTAQSTGETMAAGAKKAKNRGRSTMGKLKTGVALGIGYVLGARAGRARYEQIARASAKMASRPEVQRATQQIGGAVSSKLPDSVASKLPTTSKLSRSPGHLREDQP